MPSRTMTHAVRIRDFFQVLEKVMLLFFKASSAWSLPWPITEFCWTRWRNIEIVFFFKFPNFHLWTWMKGLPKLSALVWYASQVLSTFNLAEPILLLTSVLSVLCHLLTNRVILKDMKTSKYETPSIQACAWSCQKFQYFYKKMKS